jgi:WD40-like Beta Propeller Repeat
MKRILKFSFILCVTFSLIACNLMQVLSGGEEDAPIVENVPAETAEQVELEVDPPSPTAEPTVAPVPLIHWIAYESGGNIWVVDPDGNQFYQLTFDGTTKSGGLRYHRPLVSPDGLFVAFSSRGKFHIYSFETQHTDQIRMASPPGMLADAMLGWGEDKMLYYTRTIGVCDLSVTPMKGPDSVDIMRYDPVAKSSEKTGEIPTIDEQSHAYSIGKSITPSGRYITAYNAACSVGFGSTFVYDTETQAFERNSHGSAEISNDGSILAYVDDSNVESGGYTSIIGVDRATQQQTIIYKPRINGYVATDILWAPDDSFIAFLEWPIEDLANIRGMGGFFNTEALNDPYIVIVAVGTGDYNFDTIEAYYVPEERHRMGSWSPDGRRFVYTQWEEHTDMYGPGALMVYSLDNINASFLERQEGLRRPDW